MKIIILMFISLCLYGKNSAQAIPAQWIGHWQGELKIYNYRQAQPEKVTMQMNIDAINDSTWQWETTYTSGEKIISEKNYRLVTIDKSAGLYQVDELNGIKLQSQLLGNRLITFYEVAENLMTVTYYLRAENMHFEVCFTNKNSKIETGATGEDIPLVITYRPGTFQQAILSRHKK